MFCHFTHFTHFGLLSVFMPFLRLFSVSQKPNAIFVISNVFQRWMKFPVLYVNSFTMDKRVFCAASTLMDSELTAPISWFFWSFVLNINIQIFIIDLLIFLSINSDFLWSQYGLIYLCTIELVCKPLVHTHLIIINLLSILMGSSEIWSM